jgi:hypothetical protein
VAVFFHSLGEERKGAVRTLYHLGRELCTQGWSLLATDYAGTGESPGRFADVTCQRLAADVQAILACARERAGVVPVVAVALRIGAHILLRSGSPVPDGYALWQPCLRGDDWLLELRRRRRFRGTSSRQQSIDDIEDVDGYPFGTSLIEELSRPAPVGALSSEAWHIWQIGPRTTPSKEMIDISMQAGEANGESIGCIQAPPFWLESSPGGSKQLVAETAVWVARVRAQRNESMEGSDDCR